MAASAIPNATTSRSASRSRWRSSRHGRRQAPRTSAPVSTRIQATPAAGIAPNARTAREAPAYWETAFTTKRPMRCGAVPPRPSGGGVRDAGGVVHRDRTAGGLLRAGQVPAW